MLFCSLEQSVYELIVFSKEFSELAFLLTAAHTHTNNVQRLNCRFACKNVYFNINLTADLRQGQVALPSPNDNELIKEIISTVSGENRPRPTRIQDVVFYRVHPLAGSIPNRVCCYSDSEPFYHRHFYKEQQSSHSYIVPGYTFDRG